MTINHTTGLPRFFLLSVFKLIFIYLMSMDLLFACTSVHNAHAWCQKGASDLLGLELYMVVSSPYECLEPSPGPLGENNKTSSAL